MTDFDRMVKKGVDDKSLSTRIVESIQDLERERDRWRTEALKAKEELDSVMKYLTHSRDTEPEENISRATY